MTSDSKSPNTIKPQTIKPDANKPDANKPDTAKSVLQIRCGLGLSRADFGRVMGVSWINVLAWESGEVIPSQEEKMLLVRMLQVSEAHAERTALRPAIEVALKNGNLGQIRESEVSLSAPRKTPPSTH